MGIAPTNLSEECQMKSELVPSSRLVRSASAVVAALATALVIGFIEGLASLYGSQVHVASDQQTVIAKR